MKKGILPSLDEVKTKLEISWKQSKAIEETLNKAENYLKQMI